MVKRGTYLTLLALIVCLFVPSVSDAVVTSEPFVTDVTPVHFSVVWTTSEPTTASVSVFLDAEGTMPYIEAVVQSESADAESQTRFDLFFPDQERHQRK